MEVVVEPDRRLWELAAQNSHFWPLQQDWDYGLAVRWQAQPVLRLLAHEAGVPAACVQLVGRRWFGLAELWLALRGPVALGGQGAIPPQLLAALPRGLLRAVLLAPEIADQAATHQRWQGHTRVYTGHSCALVTLADYDRSKLRQKWRNRLNAAQARGLRIELADRGKWLDWVVGRYDQVRAAKGFAGPSADFVAQLVRLKSPRQTVAVIALDGREPVAGALFLRHGPDASYYVAASDAQGRAANAANLVLWRGLLTLKELGVRTVDLGTVDTDKSPGLARFKLGAGGQPLTLAGTYL
jgi:hypothetical protein